MAKIRGTMMSGKLGDKVYSHWNGRPYVRSKAKKVRVPGTDAQRAHWEAFAAVSRLSSDLAEAHCLGLHQAALRQNLNTHSLFKKINKDCAEGGEVDHPRVQVSRGPLPTVAFTASELTAEGLLHLAFDPDPLRRDADPTDELCLFAYRPDLRQGRLFGPVPRDAAKATLQLPADWLPSTTLHLYAFLLNHKGQSSDTLYIAV